ncbi:hypothetical protein Ancab_020032 [Ancistrocladus abbreviatus]
MESVTSCLLRQMVIVMLGLLSLPIFCEKTTVEEDSELKEFAVSKGENPSLPSEAFKNPYLEGQVEVEGDLILEVGTAALALEPNDVPPGHENSCGSVVLDMKGELNAEAVLSSLSLIVNHHVI